MTSAAKIMPHGGVTDDRLSPKSVFEQKCLGDQLKTGQRGLNPDSGFFVPCHAFRQQWTQDCQLADNMAGSWPHFTIPPRWRGGAERRLKRAAPGGEIQLAVEDSDGIQCVEVELAVGEIDRLSFPGCFELTRASVDASLHRPAPDGRIRLHLTLREQIGAGTPRESSRVHGLSQRLTAGTISRMSRGSRLRDLRPLSALSNQRHFV